MDLLIGHRHGDKPTVWELPSRGSLCNSNGSWRFHKITTHDSHIHEGTQMQNTRFLTLINQSAWRHFCSHYQHGMYINYVAQVSNFLVSTRWFQEIFATLVLCSSCSFCRIFSPTFFPTPFCNDSSCKANMDPKNGGLEEDLPFNYVDAWCPLSLKKCYSPCLCYRSC